MLNKSLQLQNKRLLLSLVDCHSTRSAESHETATLSHIGSGHDYKNKRAFPVNVSANIYFRMGEISCHKQSLSDQMIQLKSDLFYCRNLEKISENKCHDLLIIKTKCVWITMFQMRHPG